MGSVVSPSFQSVKNRAQSFGISKQKSMTAVNAGVSNDWPENKTETLNECPICADAESNTVYEKLTDITFNVAAGEWSLHQCKNCSTAYLDPRPDVESIGRAYSSYYTHEASASENVVDQFNILGLLKRGINGRLKLRYGLSREPSSHLLGQLFDWMPFIGVYFDPYGREIPVPPKVGARLLDFGCGDGSFIKIAREAGWDCTGVDFDPAAVKAASKQGLNVTQGDSSTILELGKFDCITMSHVIEHVHSPGALLNNCYQALDSGGRLWISTPNFDAYGRQRYHEFWRGLECPRHLCLFTPTSLINLLHDCGFRGIRQNPSPFVNLSTYYTSSFLREGRKVENKSLSKMLRAIPLLDSVKAIVNKSRSEFIMITCTKPV